MKLLHIDSSALGGYSVSRQLTADIVAELQRNTPAATVQYHDLAAQPLPHWTPVADASDPAVALGSQMLEEFLAANVVGTVIRLVLIRAFSSAFEDLLGPIRHFIGAYRWPLLAVSVVLVAFTIWSDHRAGRSSIGDLASMDDDIAAEERKRATASPAGDAE